MYYRPRGIEGDELVITFDAKVVILGPRVVVEFMAVCSDLIGVKGECCKVVPNQSISSATNRCS